MLAMIYEIVQIEESFQKNSARTHIPTETAMHQCLIKLSLKVRICAFKQVYGSISLVLPLLSILSSIKLLDGGLKCEFILGKLFGHISSLFGCCKYQNSQIRSNYMDGVYGLYYRRNIDLGFSHTFMGFRPCLINRQGSSK